MGRLFGTDGVRGIAGSDLSAGLALDLSVAAARVLAPAGHLAPAGDGDRRPVAVVGRDPRASGEFLEAAVVAGLTSAGVDVLRLGVLPTPGVAYLAKALNADFGVVLSASHNPARDNGIKFFARGGRKLPDSVEDQIEALLGQPGPVPPRGFGRAIDAAREQEKYLDHLVASLGAGPVPAQPPLAGLRVVVDCAHGAAYAIAPEALRRAGAEVIAIGVEPDGDNINSGCGSTHLDTVASVVRSQGADVGIAHDGDADRCLAVDADGQVVDGDQILAVLATELKQEGRLAGDTVVVTVMSNLGFRLAMDAAAISVVETPVGDRYVLEAMLAGQHSLGGEQSGHIILADYATTGDGVLTALHLLAVLARRGISLAEAAKVMTRYPQVLINVPGDKSQAAAAPELAAAVKAAEDALGSSGRILVRPSGTEPIIRVMVEAVDTAAAEHIAHQVAETIRHALA
ncbi:MAG TPA: phosphoglucosamine mutase [Streptosporangiaceae bacterium]|nr:phosphoglucosamine mutase [Streptosporangiaceae bacterium]